MPPAPRVVVELDPAEWERCCVEAGLDRAAPVRFRRFPPKAQRLFPGRPIYGEADRASGAIFIYLCVEKYDTDRYRDVANELIVTLLHELRHQVQFKTWPLAQWEAERATPYDQKPSEIDAERWATENRSSWRPVAKIRRVYRSKLARVGDAQRRVIG